MSTPPSPTLSSASTSWMAGKSTTELIPMLKNAYHALKDKEQDLMLAAQIGKSLLDNNLALKKYYEDLLNQAQTAPLPTPSSSACVILDEKHVEVVDTPQEDDDGSDMHYVPSRSTREAMIEVLERKNDELGAQLEVALEHHGLLDRNSTKEAQQLQAEIMHLRENLDIATTKIRELEEMNRNARQKRNDLTLSSEPSNEEQHQQEMNDLLSNIERLQIEKDTVAHSKTEIENKLTSTLSDLRRLKEQFEQLQFTQASHDELQAAYERQFRHVAELKESVQEHQSILQRLRDRGINIHATPSPSVYGVDAHDLSMPRCDTLFGELESAWAKRGHARPRMSVSSVTGMSTSTRPMSDYYAALHREETLAPAEDDDSFSLESILARVSGVDQHQLDEALSFVNRLEEELKTYRENEDMEDMSSSPNSFDKFPQGSLYPAVSRSTPLNSTVDLASYQPKTILGRLRGLQRQCLQAVWRWCRFSIVLTVAVLINLWHGPESMLLEPQTIQKRIH